MTPTTDTLAQLIHRRHDCLRELLGLVRQQHELAEGSDVDALLAVLNRKQPYLEALQRIGHALTPFRDDDPDQRVWADHSHRARCQQLWDECGAMYEEIVELERASEAALCLRRDQVAWQLESSHSAQAVHTAYLHGAQPLAAPVGGQLDLTEA